MAAANPATALHDEATCSICLDYFQDPVMIIDCGHNFCRACITKHSKGSSDGSACCPECRQLFSSKHLKPNRQLGNIVQTAKQLGLQLNNSSEMEGVCMEHRKPLTLFCKIDETLLCTVCNRSKAHRNHRVVYPEEAAADYKEKLQKHLEKLKKERNTIQSVKSNGEKPSQELLKETQGKRQEIVSQFQQLRQFLNEQEELQLSKLRDLEEEIERKRDDYASKFVDEIVYITDLVGDVEEKNKQPVIEFLQNIGSILDRCEKGKFQYPVVPDSSDIKRRFNQFCQENSSLQSSFRKFRDLFTALSSRGSGQFTTAADSPRLAGKGNTQHFIPLEILSEPKWIQEYVVLDRGTAHPRFLVSDDRRRVSWGPFRQEVPYSSKRFDPARCVLGSCGFLSGRHYWIVDVADATSWAVGVAQESVQRKGQFSFVPEEGIWAVGFHHGQYKALTSPPLLLYGNSPLNEVQVCLDYERQTVAFFDAEQQCQFYCFQSANFEGEKLFPFFRVGDMNTTLFLC